MPCPKCGKEFQSKGELKDHFLQDHAAQGTFEADDGSKEVGQEPLQEKKTSKQCRITNLRMKKETRVYSPEEITCKYCNYFFPEIEEFKEHAQRYRDKDGNYICQEVGCDQKYIGGQGSWSNALQIHMMKHRGEQKSISCEHCGNMFFTEQSLNAHSKDHTTRGSFSCDQCGKLFDPERNLKTHIKLHKTEGFSPCTLCPKMSSTSEGLEQHMQLHNKRRRFGCTICQARFKDSFVAKRHLLTHESEKSVICEDCDKKFRTNGMRDGHVRRVHKKERSHPCTDCDRYFFQASKMKTHLIKVHGKSR